MACQHRQTAGYLIVVLLCLRCNAEEGSDSADDRALPLMKGRCIVQGHCAFADTHRKTAMWAGVEEAPAVYVRDRVGEHAGVCDCMHVHEWMFYCVLWFVSGMFVPANRGVRWSLVSVMEG